MVVWSFVILTPSAKSEELSFGGDGLRKQMPPRLTFGNKNMPRTSRKRIILECQGKSRALIFGTLLWIIETLYNTIIFSKFGQGILLDFGRITSNRNPTFIRMNFQISKMTQTTKVWFW